MTGASARMRLPTVPLAAIPKIYTVLKWLCLIIFSLYVISPAASGSGIPDVKAYLNGVESPIFRNFFRVRTFIGKVIGSALAVSASLIMGKEGPMLHAGSILAVILGTNKWMTQQMEIAAHWGVYTYNKELRDLVAIGAACGVTTAFKAPVGGVLFAMEMSTRWRKELTWRAFMACAITVVVVRLLNTICVGHSMCSMLQWGSLIWFQLFWGLVRLQMSSMPTPYQQVWAVVILAAITGYLGCLYTSFNTWVCLVRKKWAKFMWAKILEVCIISIATSIIFYILPVMGSCKACDSQDPDHCIRGEVKFKSFAGYRCHLPNHYNDLAVLVFNPQGYIIQALFQAHSKTFSFGTMAIYAAAYWFMAAITYGAFIPSGLFTPSLIFGGCIGYRHTSYHKQTKHQWARDDPAFVVVMSVLVAAAATAYCVTYGDTVWHSLLTILSAVLVDFIALGCAVATACWMLANTFLLKRPGQHQTDQQVEWLYAFDVHCNSYLPLFLVLYVLQFFLSPILLARSLLGNLLACLLYALALSYYHYMSFLGYSALPFLERTEVFLWPIALILVAMPFALVSGFNPCRFTLGIYFG
ncbi:hypothetical protein QJQ45_005109 [Haematococcus lacustris]|nr:hypothetical protein QJQ45_005109 [Haematococcus lacustris]